MPSLTIRHVTTYRRLRSRGRRRPPSPRSGERGWPLGSSIPAPQWVDWPFRASHSAVTRHQSQLPLPATGSEGNPATSGDAPARPRQLPRFRRAVDRRGALPRFRGAVCVGVPRRPARRSKGARKRLSSRVDPCLGANLFAGHRLDRFRFHERQYRQDWPCHRCGRT
jgi:hypothetical protein